MSVSVTAVYRRDEDGNWVVRLAEEPRCHTWGRTLRAARTSIREAAELWTEELGVAAVEELTFNERIEGVAGADEASALAAFRSALEEQLTAVRASLDHFAPSLLLQGMSVRDVADLLDLSPGRISQIAPGASLAAQATKAAPGVIEAARALRAALEPIRAANLKVGATIALAAAALDAEVGVDSDEPRGVPVQETAGRRPKVSRPQPQPQR